MKHAQTYKRDLSLEFGGSLLVGKRHSIRPLSAKRPLHLVLKARNQLLLLRHRRIVQQVFAKFSLRFGIRLFELGVHSDHTHASVKTPDRERYNAFVRAVTAELVRLIPGLELGPSPLHPHWIMGQDFRCVISYIKRNMFEGEFILDADLTIQM